MEINSKGQSSIVDAMFFLLIVSLLSSALFFFVSGYGETAKKEFTRQYRSQFGVSAIETILASYVPRSECAEILKAEEVDTMLALMKEDFSDDQLFEPGTKKLFKDLVTTTMLPIQSSFDYLFYIYVPEYSSIIFSTNDNPVIKIKANPASTVGGTPHKSLGIQSVSVPPGKPSVNVSSITKIKWATSWAGDFAEQNPLMPLPDPSLSDPPYTITLTIDFGSPYGEITYFFECNQNIVQCNESELPSSSSSKRFPIVFLKYTKPNPELFTSFDEEEESFEKKKSEQELEISEGSFKPGETVYFLCSPSDIKIIEDEILLKASNVTITPPSRVFFDIFTGSSGSGRASAIANLLIWPITTLSTDDGKNIFEGIPAFNCKKFEEVVNVEPTCKNISPSGIPRAEFGSFKISALYSLIPDSLVPLVSDPSEFSVSWQMDGANPGTSNELVFAGNFDTSTGITGERPVNLSISLGSETKSVQAMVSNLDLSCWKTDSVSGQINAFEPGAVFGEDEFGNLLIEPVLDKCKPGFDSTLIEFYCESSGLINREEVDCSSACSSTLETSETLLEASCSEYVFPLTTSYLNPSGKKGAYCKCKKERNGVVFPGEFKPTDLAPKILFMVSGLTS